MDKRETATQFAKFLVVGVLNSALTLIVIMVCKSVLGINPWVSNALGYVAGVINSFLWNRSWVFHDTDGRWHRQAVVFTVGFLTCYILQLAVTWALTELTPLKTLLVPVCGFTLSGYGIATVIGMGCYTLANFIYNRKIAFNRR